MTYVFRVRAKTEDGVMMIFERACRKSLRLEEIFAKYKKKIKGAIKSVPIDVSEKM